MIFAEDKGTRDISSIYIRKKELPLFVCISRVLVNQKKA